MDDIFIDNSILIVPNNIKEDILFKLNNIKANIKLMNLNEFINSVTFFYDEKTIIYIIKNYNVSYDVALKYLNDLKYLKKDKYKSKKLNFLLSLKKDLDSKSLLIYDELFLKLIENKKIIMYGYSKIDKFSKYYIDKFNIKVIKKSLDYKHDIYQFNNINDEVEFIFEKICNLINNGISINNIKIANCNEEYNNILYRMSKFYNININFKNNMSIYSCNLVKDFIDNLNENINITLEYIENKYDLSNEEELFIYNKIVKLLNKYYFIDNYLEVKNVLIDELKSIKFKSKIYKNAIELININDNFMDDNDYVFLISFNQGIIPKIYKDEDYLSDSDKKELEIESSSELNLLEKESVLFFIKNTRNLIITYKKVTPFNSYYKSSLVEELPYKIIVNPKLERKYSNINNKLNLAKDLDNYIKYSEISDRLNILYNKYDIKYKSFNNKYKKISIKCLESYLNNKLTLSYSSMNDYYKCSFKYYIKNILKIDKYEETIDTIIGNLFHYILSICFNSNFNFEKEFNNYITKYDLSIQEAFYINKLKEDLKLIIKAIKKQYSHISLNKSLYEEEFYINFNGNIKITFKGFIDKILYKEENNNVYAIIIDYKTGSDTININNSIYGINMQLPVYLYLARNTNKLKNVKVIGFYLQKLLDNPKKDSKKTTKEVKEDNLKLQGYSISDENLLSLIDDTYEDSEIIKSLKKAKNGFYQYSKVLTEKNIDNLYNLTEEKINNAINSIRNAEFEINPKKIGDKLTGCEFCKYNDICFKENKDIIFLEEHKNLDFLGGDINA